MSGLPPYTFHRRVSPFNGLEHVSCRPSVMPVSGNMLTATQMTTYRTRQLVNPCCGLQLLFENAEYNNGGPETFQTSPLTITGAAVEYPATTITPLRFNGQNSVTIPAGNQVVSDPLPIDIISKSYIWVRVTVPAGSIVPCNYEAVYVSGGGANGSTSDSVGGYIYGATNASPIVISTNFNHNLTTGNSVTIVGVGGNTAANGTWTVTVVNSVSFSLNSSTGNGAFASGGYFTGSDLTQDGSANMAGTGGVLIYGPRAIYGAAPYGVTPLWAAIFGDSIAAGSGDAVHGGWVLAGLGATNTFYETSIPALQCALPGTTASEFTPDALSYFQGSIRRRQSAFGAPYSFLQYGTNDLYGSSRTLAQLQADNIAIAQNLALRGSRVLVSTLTPRTTSTDSWATTTNQTTLSAELARIAYNTWLRAGAPITISSGVATAVAIGTSGAVVAGQSGHPFWKVIDPASYVEVNSSNVLALNGGLWIVDGTANWPTLDGTHPAAPVAALAAACVPLTSLTAFQ